MRVRKQVGPNRFVKIGVQLYQVDQKSYLLDFRFFDQSLGKRRDKRQKRFYYMNLNISAFLKEEIREAEAEQLRSADKEIKHHNVMEFFELCADLIGSLAR